MFILHIASDIYYYPDPWFFIQHFQLLITLLIIITSVNELLKIKDELTKDRDEKLSEITKVLESLILFLL